jgi:hypothetical protein
MSMQEKAFPTGTGVTPYNPGMNLRDYFAAQALKCWHLGHCTEDYHKHAAKQAYAIADAMMEERNAKQ